MSYVTMFVNITVVVVAIVEKIILMMNSLEMLLFNLSIL